VLRLGVILVAMALSAGGTFAAELACEGPFAKDSDHKRLVAAFGAKNVIRKTVYEPEGLEVRASIVFPKDPVRRFVVLWFDEKNLRRPARIDLVGSSWSGPKGLLIGSSIAAVEQANGKPFTLYGFDWDYGGSTESWNGGALGNLPGDCAFAPIFEPDYTTSDEIQNAVSGDTQFASDSQAMRAAKVRIKDLALSYARK
jgi:hypothetical protein